MNHYIYCKKNKIDFQLDSSNWMFKSINGWDDYFLPVNMSFSNNSNINEKNNDENTILQYGYQKILYAYPIYEYKNIVNEIYMYNEITNNKIIETKQRLNLHNNYASIFIRRGDKLVAESKYYTTEKYITLLLKKEPNCKKIFVQTDDYNTFLDLQKYIIDNTLNIEIFTLCPEYLKGAIICNYLRNINSNIINNNNYFQQIQNEYKKTKSVDEMSSLEIYEHTMDMIIGLDIVFNSDICILDYQSNVSRFIKLAHKFPENVFDIEGFDLDLNKNICPAYPESVYDNPDKWRHIAP